METLAARVAREGPLNERDAVGWAIRLCKRVEELHVLGVAHGGISALLLHTSGTDCTATGTLGDVREAPIVPAYHCPERVHGQGISLADDTWAVAVTLYYMLTGTMPYAGVSPDEIRERLATAAPAPLAVFDVGDDDLQGILDRFLARDPSRRVVQLRQLRDALQAWHPNKGAKDLPPLDDGAEDSFGDFDDDEEEHVQTVMRDFSDVRQQLRKMQAERTSASPVAAAGSGPTTQRYPNAPAAPRAPVEAVRPRQATSIGGFRRSDLPGMPGEPPQVQPQPVQPSDPLATARGHVPPHVKPGATMPRQGPAQPWPQPQGPGGPRPAQSWPQPATADWTRPNNPNLGNPNMPATPHPGARPPGIVTPGSMPAYQSHPNIPRVDTPHATRPSHPNMPAAPISGHGIAPPRGSGPGISPPGGYDAPPPPAASGPGLRAASHQGARQFHPDTSGVSAPFPLMPGHAGPTPFEMDDHDSEDDEVATVLMDGSADLSAAIAEALESPARRQPGQRANGPAAAWPPQAAPAPMPVAELDEGNDEPATSHYDASYVAAEPSFLKPSSLPPPAQQPLPAQQLQHLPPQAALAPPPEPAFQPAFAPPMAMFPAPAGAPFADPGIHPAPRPYDAGAVADPNTVDDALAAIPAPAPPVAGPPVAGPPFLFEVPVDMPRRGSGLKTALIAAIVVLVLVIMVIVLLWLDRKNVIDLGLPAEMRGAPATPPPAPPKPAK